MKIPIKSQPGVIRSTLLAFVCLAISACGTTTQIAPYQTFAQAGIVIADSVPPLLDESIALTIENDSHQLAEFRDSVDDIGMRSTKLNTSNQLIKDRIEVFRDLRQHARVMRSYFVTLQSLATSDAAAGIQTSTNGLVQQLGQLQQQVMGTSGKPTFINAGITNALPLAANMAVTSYQYNALSDELERNGETIERELAFLEAALVTLRDIAAGEFAALQAAKQRDEIDLPYLKGNLPASWSAKRQQSFEARLKMSSLDNASNAARDLRLSFIALAEGRLSPGAANELLANAVNILTILDQD